MVFTSQPLAVGLTVLTLAAAGLRPAWAQQQPRTADERAIWALIQAPDDHRRLSTDDVIFVSGAYPRPIIGRQPTNAGDTATAEADAVVRQRSKISRTVRPQRVVVSRSGDMAYGFAYFDMEFDRPDSAGAIEHVKFEGTNLTIWRKIAGQWRLEVTFSRPNE